MIDIEKLQAAMPGMATQLGEMMVTDALRMYRETGTALEEALPAVSIVYATKDGGRLKVSLELALLDEAAWISANNTRRS